MNATLSILLLFFSALCFGQKNPAGLYGKCNDSFSAYVCQQVVLKEGGTFTFYDLLHLRGWTQSHGKWEQKGDTIVLNSLRQPYTLEYKGSSFTNDIVIVLRDTIGPFAFANVKFNSADHHTDVSGMIKCSKRLLDTLGIYHFSIPYLEVLPNKEKVKAADTLEIIFSIQYGETLFTNEKWLLRDKKLYHTRKTDGTYEKEAYFERTRDKELKYKEDH